MESIQLLREIQRVPSGNILFELRNQDGAIELTKEFIRAVSKCTGTTEEEIYVQLFKNNPYVQNCTTSEDDVQNCTTKLGYNNTFDKSVYDKLDKLIREGFSNKVIAEKLGIHRNTVSNRRKKIGL